MSLGLGREPAQALAGVPAMPEPRRLPPLLHAAGAPGSLPPASSRQAPRGEAPGPSPATPLPLFPGRPWTSRGSFAAKVGCHTVPGGCWAGTRPWFRPSLLGGCPSPGAFFGGVLCSWENKGRSK